MEPHNTLQKSQLCHCATPPKRGLAYKILATIQGADCLFIAPPFARSCLGALLDPHTLHAIAVDRGFTAETFYLNALLASTISLELSESISGADRTWLLGERMFSRAAYGVPPLGARSETARTVEIKPPSLKPRRALGHQPAPFAPKRHLALERQCYSFIQQVAPIIASLEHHLICLCIGWDQINCSIALIERLKELMPQATTIVAGQNCEGDTARGILSLSDAVDYVISGEPEIAFAHFLDRYKAKRLPRERLIDGPPVSDMDWLPLPQYDDFFDQARLFLGPALPSKLALTYETSRGCSKGRKQRCAFCGLNSPRRIAHRRKSAEKVASDLNVISQKHPAITVFMADHTAPAYYYSDLFPRASFPKELSIRYQLLASIAPHELIKLKEAGVDRIQPGIEALSTPLLDLINKGVRAHQNIFLLRNALCADIRVYWYLLWGIPGDRIQDYVTTLTILPLLRHLQPPESLAHVRLDRNSQYVQAPEKYGIENIRPEQGLREAFPTSEKLESIATSFRADYPCESHDNPEIIQAIQTEIAIWKKQWRTASLTLVNMWGRYMVYDSRCCDSQPKSYILERQPAKKIITQERFTGADYQEWALTRKLAIVCDEQFVPLVTAKLELLEMLEAI